MSDLVSIHRAFANLSAALEEAKAAWRRVAEKTGMDGLGF